MIKGPSIANEEEYEDELEKIVLQFTDECIKA